MDKKLYRVRVTLYVMAENASGACVAATKAPFDIFECHARKAEHVDTGWEDAIPYNADDDLTCTEVLTLENALHSSATAPRIEAQAALRYIMPLPSSQRRSKSIKGNVAPA
jgi:hypothetical protein